MLRLLHAERKRGSRTPNRLLLDLLRLHGLGHLHALDRPAIDVHVRVQRLVHALGERGDPVSLRGFGGSGRLGDRRRLDGHVTVLRRGVGGLRAGEALAS